MSGDLTRFYIALPGCRGRHPNFRRREKSPDAIWKDMPCYLRDLPQMPDFLIHISGCRNLTRAEQDCLSRQIQRLAQVVRAARERWRDETGATEEDLQAGGLL